MVKLSQQLSVPVGRETRTQRLVKQAEVKKERERREVEYQALKQRAEVEQQKLSGVTSLEDYKLVYSGIDPELKPFFSTPEEVGTGIETKRQEDLTKLVKKRISINTQKIEEEKEYRKKREELEEWWRNKPSSYTSISSNRKRFEEERKKLKDDYEEDRDYWEGYIKGLNEGEGKLRSGQSLTYNSITSFANKKGKYSKSLREAKNEESKERRKQQQKIAKLEEEGFKPFLVEQIEKGRPVSAKVYLQKGGEFEKIGEFKPQTIETSTLIKSKQIAPVIKKYKVGKEEYEFKGTTPVYEGEGGKLSTVYGDLGVTKGELVEEYNIKKETEAQQYLKDTGFTEKAGEKVDVEDPNLWDKFNKYVNVFSRKNIIRASSLMAIGWDVRLPEETHVQRETGFSKWVSGLTFGEASAGLEAQELKEEKAQLQVEKIEEFAKTIEEAPEDLKYFVQEEGRRELGSQAGIITFEEGDELKFMSPELDRSLTYFESRAIRETEEKNLLGKTFLYTGYGSGKAVEFYGIGKLIGFGLGLGVKGYTGIRTALGGGLKYVDASLKGSKILATIEQTKGLGKIGKSLKWIGTGTAIVGVTGLYGYGKYKSYKYYKEEFGDLGKEMFAVETTGELVGIGALVGEGAYRQHQIKKMNQRALKINYLKQQKAQELKLIKEQVKLGAGKGKQSYQQLGLGKKVLSPVQQKQLAKEYANIKDISQIEAMKHVKEAGVYKQSYQVKSNVPSYDRLIKYVKTGKMPKGTSDTLTFNRYGILETTKTAKGSQTLAIEWSKSGSKIANILAKTTQAKHHTAITSVYEQARYSPKLNIRGFQLKKIIVSKATPLKAGKLGDAKIEIFDIENRLLKTVGDPQRYSIQQIYKAGKIDRSSELLKEVYKYSGKSSKSSVFRNIRIDKPYYQDVGGGLKIHTGEYIYQQRGLGKSQIPLKDVIQKLEKAHYFQTLKKLTASRKPKITSFEKTFGESKILKEEIKSINKATSQILKTDTLSKVSTEQLSRSVSSSIQTPQITSQVRLESLIGSKMLQNLGAVSITAIKPALDVKDIQKADLSMKSMLDISSANKINQVLRTDLQAKTTTKQTSLLRQLQAQTTGLTTPSMISFVPSTTFKVPKTPNIPNIPYAIWPYFPSGIGKKKKKKGRKTVQDLAYLPDFTARAIGLKPEVISGKQAQARIKKILTGLEIRKGVVVK